MEKRGIIRSIISRFSASAVAEPAAAKRVQLNGAKYTAIDTGDGYHIVKDIPILSEIKKGTHNAPYDVTKDVLLEFEQNIKSRYQRNRAGGLSIGHNDDMGITHPNFAGFFVASRVGEYNFPHDGKKWTLFADFKMPNDKFQLLADGKLPWHSPEIYGHGWENKKIELVSFLDSRPPYFDFENNTVGEIIKDETARFEAIYDGPGSRFEDFERQLLDNDLEKLFDRDNLKRLASKFAAYEKEEPSNDKKEGDSETHEKGETAAEEKKEHEGGKGEKPAPSEPDALFERQFPEASRKLEAISTTVTKLAQHLGLDGRDSTQKKPDGKPVEPGEDLGGSKMGLTPEEAAKFAAQANEVAEIKKTLAEKERKEKVSAFMAKADSILARKVLADRGIVSEFASQAVDRADGEKWFTDMVEKLKPSLRDKPPTTEAEFAAASGPSIEPTDPILSKFHAQGASMDEVSKFASQWRQLKSHLGDRFSCDEESYIKNEILQAKYARENGSYIQGSRR